MKKFKKVVIVIPIITILMCSMCIRVSALTIGDINDDNKSSVISNCTFNYINFETYNSAGGYLATPGDDAYLYFNSNLLILNALGTDGFGGSSSFYRTFIFDIVLPYSTEKQDFTMNVDSPISKSTFDFSVGVNSFIKSGSISGKVVKNSDNTLTYSIANVPGGSTLHCQVSFLCYSSWSVFQISFNDISISSLGASDIIDNQDKNTDKEIQADKENTQAIIDNQNQLAEQEKQEVIDSGNDSVDGAMEIMPSYDLGDVFDGFVNVMHYDGLDCYLDIPEIYIPEIPNVTSKVVLYSGGQINFKDYFDLIPNTILLVVRAVLTVALILFAFKELWTTIGQVLSGEGIKIMRNGLEGD